MTNGFLRPHLFLVLLLALPAAGCFGMTSYMSSFAEGLGSECATYRVEAQVFDNAAQKWVDGSYDGDWNWLNARGDYYLSQFRFLVVEETSPAGNRYKFATSCAAYY